MKFTVGILSWVLTTSCLADVVVHMSGNGHRITAEGLRVKDGWSGTYTFTNVGDKVDVSFTPKNMSRSVVFVGCVSSGPFLYCADKGTACEVSATFAKHPNNQVTLQQTRVCPMFPNLSTTVQDQGTIR